MGTLQSCLQELIRMQLFSIPKHLVYFRKDALTLLNSETSGDSKSAFLHCEDALHDMQVPHTTHYSVFACKHKWGVQNSYLASCVRSSIIRTSGESGTRDQVHKLYGRGTGSKGTSAEAQSCVMIVQTASQHAVLEANQDLVHLRSDQAHAQPQHVKHFGGTICVVQKQIQTHDDKLQCDACKIPTTSKHIARSEHDQQPSICKLDN